MSDPRADGHPTIDDVLFRAEAWLERLESITTRLEEIEWARSMERRGNGQ